MLALTCRKASIRVGKEVKTGQFSIKDSAGRIKDGGEKLKPIQENHGLKPSSAKL